ncbi:Hachiman antiphage defense system protein HamA, partial [Klebsiella michiganensis]|uniref:Hachiman antiphage defense system protein HamA n=2 Tax=Klebsiella/Raoultella group TaxID=2890311 RepID=UPI000EFC16A9
CMKSISPLITSSFGDGSAEERDIQLLSDFMNVDDPNLEAALKKFLDPDNPEFNKLEYRGICLVGFDIDDYPTEPNKLNINGLLETFSDKIDSWRDNIKKRIIEESIHGISLHVFLIPFPSVDSFRQTLITSLNGD